MARTLNITGAAWPASGAASTVTVGNTGGTVTNLTHVGSTDVPPGSAASGYLTGGENTTVTLKLQADLSAELNANDTDAWLRVWIRGRVTTEALLPVDATAPGGTNFFRVSGTVGGTRFRAYLVAFKSGLAAWPADYQGYVLGVNAGTWTVSTPVTTMPPEMGDTTARPPNFPLGIWNEVVFHIKRKGTPDGLFEMFVNGQCAGRITGMETNTDTDDSTSVKLTDLQGDPQFVLQAVTGITWDYCAPLEVWSGTDITINPLWSSFASSSDDLCAMWGCSFLDMGADKGGYFATSGTATAATAPIVTTGNRPIRNRVTFTGTAGQTGTIASYGTIGAASLYTGTDNWMTVVYPMIYAPAGVTVAGAIRNSGDTGDIIAWSLNGTNIVVNGVTLTTHTQANRFLLAIQLNSSTGEVKAGAIDLTKVPAQSAPTVDTAHRLFSASAGTWTPATLGKVTATFTFTGSVTGEIDGIEIYRKFDLWAADSYVRSDMASTPACGMHNHISRAMASNVAASRFPGAARQGYKNGTVLWPRLGSSGIVGYQGRSFNEFVTWHLPDLDALRGVRLFLINGGFINDMVWAQNLSGTLSTQAQLETLLSAYETNLKTCLDFATSRGWNVEISLPLPGEQSQAGTLVVAAGTGTFTLSAGTTGYAVGDIVTIRDCTTPGVNARATILTTPTTSSFTFSTSVAAATYSCNVSYYSDLQLQGFKRAAELIDRVASSCQRNNLIRVGPGYGASASASFTTGDDIHPKTANAGSPQIAAAYWAGTATVNTPAGWKRRRRREFMQF